MNTSIKVKFNILYFQWYMSRENGFLFPIGSTISYILISGERKTSMDERDGPVVNFTLLDLDSRGRRGVQGKKDLCLHSKERKNEETKRKKKNTSIGCVYV